MASGLLLDNCGKISLIPHSFTSSKCQILRGNMDITMNKRLVPILMDLTRPQDHYNFRTAVQLFAYFCLGLRTQNSLNFHLELLNPRVSRSQDSSCPRQAVCMQVCWVAGELPFLDQFSLSYYACSSISLHLANP